MFRRPNLRQPTFNQPNTGNVFLAELEEQITLSMTQFVSETGARVWGCSICQKSAKGKADIKRHVETHFNVEQNCRFCGKSAKNSEALRTHVKTYHKPHQTSPSKQFF